MTAAPDQRPDDALIREARDASFTATTAYETRLFTRLADALEQRGAQLEREREQFENALGKANGNAVAAERRALAAEAEVQRLRAAITTAVEGLPGGHARATIDYYLEQLRAALRPSSEGDR